jgi:NurA-like 5'-3' nuclease
MKTKVTKNELEILTNVANCQIEEGYSEYTSISNESEKGILGSLVKKELIYDCYSGMGEGYMFCLTDKGIEACQELGISINHIQLF